MKRFTSQELRDAFLNFFKEKGHEVVPSSSLIPADPTSLFTSAGMQQFVPYLSGEVEPPYKTACSVQKCLRVDDVEEVGDSTHHTFFEMLGNWSFGDYFKEGAIDYALEFLIDVCEIPKEKLRVSIFKGEDGISRDDEAERLWIERGFPKEEISEYDSSDNFWGPVATTGPCGPCSEIFVDRTGESCGPDCHPNDDCGRFVEVWNLVFMEYNKDSSGNLTKLKQQNVDTGIGFERLLSLLWQVDSNYDTDLFSEIIKRLEERSGRSYENEIRRFRTICDHLRASCFLISDGVRPSNTDRGYILRMLLRRVLRHLSHLDASPEDIIDVVVTTYSGFYPELEGIIDEIISVIRSEDEKFGKALRRGEKEFEKIAKEKGKISGEDAFNLYQSYGFPLELISEMADEKGIEIDREGYQDSMEKHKEASRKGAEKKFGGVGIDQLENEEDILKATKLHTATHLLQAALREVLGNHVQQMGSNVSPERLRFDFSHKGAMSIKEKERVEELVNEHVHRGLSVSKEQMLYTEAIESGVLAFFKEKYPEMVNVYSIGDVSRELCGGPHVANTKDLGIFKIIKEESVGAGTRRIKATLQ